MKRLPVAIVGTGPAGLMASHVLASEGIETRLFEKRRSPGRKLLIAGSSGLNIGYDCPLSEFHLNYRGLGVSAHFERILAEFPPERWLAFINEELGIATFKGTSRRYFVEGMKAAGLLRAWLELLKARGASVALGRELTGFSPVEGGVRLEFAGHEAETFSAACFCLGGGSYEPEEKPLRWPAAFQAHGLKLNAFVASNVGFQVQWPAAFLKEAEGLPLKNVVLTSKRGRRAGEMVITRYGLEGTPVYFAGETGVVTLDLKPDLNADEITRRLQASKENLSPMRRVKKYLKLSPAALALVFHHSPPSELGEMVRKLKWFPIELGERQPIDEAISSSGGLALGELNEAMMIRKTPGAFAAGEMLDWDAPTGGFLIQGCVSQGHRAGRGIAEWLRAREA
jgi:uncharacterized flavoprotein (TIGR03862 family)